MLDTFVKIFTNVVQTGREEIGDSGTKTFICTLGFVLVLIGSIDGGSDVVGSAFGGILNGLGGVGEGLLSINGVPVRIVVAGSVCNQLAGLELQKS